MATFELAVETVLANEGGYVHRADDPGGETNFGISKRRYPDLDIKGLTRTQAVEIYRRDYWHPEWAKLNQALATKLLDAAVNAGPETAVRALQQAINDEGFGPLKVDGIFGPSTLQAARLCPAEKLLRGYRARAAWHYIAIVLAKREREVFLLGWLRRAVAVLALTLLPIGALAQQDTLERMEEDFLQLSEPCNALPAEEQRVNGRDYRLRLYRCGARVWRLWQYRCPEGTWSRVFLLDQANDHDGSYYLDRFASLHNGTPGFLVEAYRPTCGS